MLQKLGRRARTERGFGARPPVPDSVGARVSDGGCQGIVYSVLIVILLIILAAVTGVLGFIIKGAFWLLVFTLVFLVAAYFAGRASRR
jgi:hypothetical protein